MQTIYTRPIIVYRDTITGLRVSAVDGTAFVDALPQAVLDLIALYPGALLFEAYDSSNRKLSGVLDAVGTGETLGGELVTNPGAEAALSNMNGVALSGNVATFSQSTTQKHAGTYSNKVAGTAVESTINVRFLDGSNCGLTAGVLYKQSEWVYVASGQSITSYNLNIRNNAGTTYESQSSTTLDAFTQLSGYFTDDDVQRVLYTLLLPLNIANVIMYLDDLSVKQVLTPSTSGATIVTEKAGATFNFNNKNASFTYNQTTNYVVVKKLK